VGSVKDLTVLKNPTESEPGLGRFSFSDRYSVFDWGEMPDRLPDKGAALCITSAFFFEKLAERGVKSHYRGLVEDGAVKKLAGLNKPVSAMEVKLLRVIVPALNAGIYDYSAYAKKQSNCLIPLEIIYRNSLPEGSSVFRRLKSGALSLADLRLKEPPRAGQVLETPFIDVSTKLETTDRYLTWDEAAKISGLGMDAIEKVKRTAELVDQVITESVTRIGLNNEDGKIELGWDEAGDFVVVDALGTLDECRFTFHDLPVSKEIARIFYRGTDWFAEVERVKREDKINWKDRVTSAPPRLPDRLAELITLIYKAFTHELTQREWFGPVPPLKDLLAETRAWVPSGTV
jgi:phosphoribosylaminoimidazole-succinocarboxamide synthase